MNGRLARRGFTLLELLIAVLTLSVGVLGVASLQILTTQSSFSASQRTEATMLANAVIDRMRANSEQLATYTGNELDGAAAPSGTEPSGCTQAMSEANCQLATAQRDLWELHQAAHQADTLVAPTICIENGAGSDGDVTVVVAWHSMSERATADDSALHSCGKGDDDDTLQQVSMSTYITPLNPH